MVVHIKDNDGAVKLAINVNNDYDYIFMINQNEEANYVIVPDEILPDLTKKLMLICQLKGIKL